MEYLALSGRPDAVSYVHGWASVGSVVHKTTQPVSFMAGLIRRSVYLSSTARGCGRPLAAWRRLEGHLAAVERLSMQDPVSELRRIHLPRTRVNKPVGCCA